MSKLFDIIFESIGAPKCIILPAKLLALVHELKIFHAGRIFWWASELNRKITFIRGNEKIRRFQSIHENKFALDAKIFLEKIFFDELLTGRRNQNYRRIL